MMTNNGYSFAYMRQSYVKGDEDGCGAHSLSPENGITHYSYGIVSP